MKNNEVTQKFINGFESKTKHLFSEFKKDILVLYSYGYHFPLCIKLLDNTFLINSNGYSNTTSRHKSYLCKNLGFNSFKELEKTHNNNIILMTTNQLLDVILKGFKNKSEIIEEKI